MAERYTITETLRASGSIVLQRGFRSCDRRPILLKRPSSPSPSPEAVRQLNHEWAIVRALAPGRVLRPLALEPHARGALLVLEDFQGVPLRGLLGARMDIGRFLRIAVEVTAAAEELHAHGVVHKAIRPDSILVDFETAEVKLTDLGFASLLPREHQETQHPSLIRGSFPCVSPEQTGRMNRALELRTDLFSLGVTFYEMLTGELPFRATDPLEWAHGHLVHADLLSGAVTLSSLVHPDDRDRVMGEIAACVAAGRDRFEQEYRVVRGDRRVRWVDDRTVIERDATGRVCNYQSILADVTEKRAADDPR